MADLLARAAFAGLDLPLTRGAAVLGAAEDAPMLAIAPFRGRATAVAAVIGSALPGSGKSVALANGGLLLWAGLDQWLLRGADASGALADRLALDAAAVDVTDGWAALVLAGEGARDVLARLVPLDLDARVMPTGRVARTLLRHIACLIAVRPQDLLIFVPRSCAASAVEDIARAMAAVAERAAHHGGRV